jgi:hypothetical protein
MGKRLPSTWKRENSMNLEEEKMPTVTGREKGSMFLEVRKAHCIWKKSECTWKEKAQCNWKRERLSVPGRDKTQCTWKRKNASL